MVRPTSEIRPSCCIPFQDPRWCSVFDAYIAHAFKADLLEQNIPEPSAEKTRELAYNHLHFWLDVFGAYGTMAPDRFLQVCDA